MPLNSVLSAFTALPGVVQAAVGDDAGRLLELAGQTVPPPSTAMLVLAHATLAAAAELGRYAGNGSCLEILQQHETGVFYLRALTHRRLLLVRCQSAEAVPAVRQLSQQVLHSILAQPSAAVAATLDLASALHAEPQWRV